MSIFLCLLAVEYKFFHSEIFSFLEGTEIFTRALDGTSKTLHQHVTARRRVGDRNIPYHVNSLVFLNIITDVLCFISDQFVYCHFYNART